MTWDFASDPDPDIVLLGIGDYPTKEIIAAVDLAKRSMPGVALRVVNVSSLTSCGLGSSGMCVSQAEFDRQFTASSPVICNFHGYPETLKSILFSYIDNPKRFTVRGYVESGSTTTPFDMHVRNHTSRYHLAMEIARRALEVGKITSEQSAQLIQHYQKKIDDNTAYIKIHGVDNPEIEEWTWTR